MICCWAACLYHGRPTWGSNAPVSLGWFGVASGTVGHSLLCALNSGTPGRLGTKGLSSWVSSLPSTASTPPFLTINSGLPRLQYHIEGLLKRPTHAQTLPEDQVEALKLWVSLFLSYEKCTYICNTVVLAICYYLYTL